MNQRIRELAEQASHQSPDGYPVTIPYSKDFAEKFAELIVRECAKVSERTGALNEADYEGEMIADAIKEHFGVESKNQLICPKCGTDRLRVDCPNPNRLDCGIKVEAL